MKKYILSFVLALIALASCSKGGNDPRLVIITFDGLRWQELYSGVDEALIDAKYVENPESFKEAYWRDTPEARREALMPFVWSYVPQHGYMIGNRVKNSLMSVANNKSFSYPGYSEMFCGWADDERVISNDPELNPNVSVLEVANADPRYKDKLMMYSSWESIRFAVGSDRGGFKASSAHEAPFTSTAITELLQTSESRGLIHDFGQSERDDFVTCCYALETIKAEHPKVFYVGFGDTDEYGHEGHYDHYIDAIHASDAFVRHIVETCEADPFYAGKTTYLILCDHGRGRGQGFTDHGASTRGSNETWFMAFGKDVPVLGETSDNGPFYNKQLAATIADILGIEFTPGNGVKSDPIDPAFYQEPEIPEAEMTLAAMDVTPKGQGLKYTYSEGDFMSVGEVLAAPVKASGIMDRLSTDVKLREDHFGLVIKGLFKIEKEGLYQASAVSDDGCKVWIDDKLLWDIDRDGGGFSQTWINFASGYHRVEVQYFENYGSEVLEIGLVGNGLSYDNLPAEMLYHE